MEQIVLIVHVLVALAIIGLIMIQQGKGADMGASFGAGASQTLFGSGGGGNVLTSATSWLVTLFFATSFGLAVIAKENSMAAGNVDLPMPAVIESFEMPADVRESDIPGIDAAVFEEIPGAGVPVEGSGSDIPGL
jgi:preprotein translocase subunit SecG|tara:strand:- start:3084 stop:3488 length:405 start_codon:yes stop_codon:yes gene_type:complete